jgi:hypothetical protein
MAEAEALDERLVGLVVHLGQELPAGRVVARAKALVVLKGSPEAHREGPDLAGEIQPPARGGQHEPRLAAFARVLDERRGFLGCAH